MYIGAGASKRSIEKVVKEAIVLEGVLGTDCGKVAKGTDVTGMTIRDLILQAYIEETAVDIPLPETSDNNVLEVSENSIANLGNLIHKNTADINKIQIIGVNS